VPIYERKIPKTSSATLVKDPMYNQLTIKNIQTETFQAIQGVFLHFLPFRMNLNLLDSLIAVTSLLHVLSSLMRVDYCR